MIHAVILTHGKFGEEMVKIAETIVGPVKGIDVVSLELEDNPASFEEKVKAVLGEVEDNLLIVADIFGGTPCNTGISLLQTYNAQIITGLNLGMLLELMLTISIVMTAKEMAVNLLEVSKKTCQILSHENYSQDSQDEPDEDRL